MTSIVKNVKILRQITVKRTLSLTSYLVAFTSMHCKIMPGPRLSRIGEIFKHLPGASTRFRRAYFDIFVSRFKSSFALLAEVLEPEVAINKPEISCRTFPPQRLSAFFTARFSTAPRSSVVERALPIRDELHDFEVNGI